MINATQIQSLTPDSFLLTAHKVVSVPFLLALYIITIGIFLGIGLIFANNKTKYFILWICSVILSGLFLLAFIFLPNLIFNFIR